MLIGVCFVTCKPILISTLAIVFFIWYFVSFHFCVVLAFIYARLLRLLRNYRYRYRYMQGHSLMMKYIPDKSYVCPQSWYASHASRISLFCTCSVTLISYLTCCLWCALVCAGTLNSFAPTKAFSSITPTVALEGQNASIRCFFYG